MRGVLLTGMPGVGKTTACRKVAERCKEQGFRVEGFFTEELRQHRARIGFDVVELRDGLPGRRVPLARIGNDSPKVGKYSVTLEDFESLVFPVLDRIAKLDTEQKVICILDEIGKMELFSKGFESRMRKLLAERPVPILCTIAVHGGGFIAEAKRNAGFDLLEITHESRDAASDDILARLVSSIGADGGYAHQMSKRSHRWHEKPLGTTMYTQPARIASVPSSDSRRWGKKKQSESSETDETTSCSRQSSNRHVVFWFRNDLRVQDNPLLHKAVHLSQNRHAAFLPVFCFDPRDYAPHVHTTWGSPKVGKFRRCFIEEAVSDLASSFESLGSKLLVFDAAPEIVLPALVQQGDIILATCESCPEELAAEARVHSALKEVGAELQLADSGGMTTIFGAAELKQSGLEAGPNFPEDFRAFYNKVRGRIGEVCQQGLYKAPEKLPATSFSLPPSVADFCHASTPSTEPPPGCADPKIIGGESEGHKRMRHWLQFGGLRSYKTTFRFLAGDYSSRLSAHLALGCISPCRVCIDALQAVPTGSHVEHFLYELCWRDFFRHVARRWGASLFHLHGPLSTKGSTAWRRDSKVEDRWRHGLTGVPLVDAAMRELLATGYIGNLARQIVAAYLVEDLGIDWRIGADWFESTLLDYDPHSNWGQWARSAGVVPTNEGKRQRVGGTRYFDIALNLANDEAASYIRRWVPQLAAVTDSHVFAPWLLGDTTLGDYAQPPLCSASLQKYFEEVGQKRQLGSKGSKSHGSKGSRSGKGGKGLAAMTF